jgi:hypothetical protein
VGLGDIGVGVLAGRGLERSGNILLMQQGVGPAGRRGRVLVSHGACSGSDVLLMGELTRHHGGPRHGTCGRGVTGPSDVAAALGTTGAHQWRHMCSGDVEVCART